MNNAMIVKNTKNLPDNFKTILVQLGDIGDVVLTTPTIRALKESYPGSRLIVCVREKASELIAGDRWTDGIISVNKQKRSISNNIRYQATFFRELRKYRFDLVIELRTGTRGAFITFLSGAKHRIGRYAVDGGLWRNSIFTHLVDPENEETQYSTEHNLNIVSPLGLEINSMVPEITITPEVEEKVSRILKKEGINSDKPIIVFHPFSLWEFKEWGINQSVELIDYLSREHDFTVIITGAPEERERARRVVAECSENVHNLAGRTSIIELAVVLQQCRFFIGVDTAALHMAAALDKPTIGIFGPSSTVCWAPRGDHHYIVSKDMSCVPCRQKGCSNSGVSKCLDELSFDDIKGTVDKQLSLCV